MSQANGHEQDFGAEKPDPSSPLEPGQLVVCIEPVGDLIAGNSYRVLETNERPYPTLILEGYREGEFLASRFRKANKIPEGMKKAPQSNPDED